MKNQLEIVLFAIALPILVIRLYQKYFKKKSGNSGQGNKKTASFSYSSEDDEYEPYSKK
jgi:hypothetical protein